MNQEKKGGKRVPGKRSIMCQSLDTNTHTEFEDPKWPGLARVECKWGRMGREEAEKAGTTHFSSWEAMRRSLGLLCEPQ